jgi:uncharacterized coiled-coil protein SlyX
METGIITIIGDLAATGQLTDTTLLIIIISLLGLSLKYLIIPLASRLKKQPSTDELNAAIHDVSDVVEEQVGVASAKLSRLLDKLVEKLDDVDEVVKNNGRDITEIKHDVEQIKQILNQFQGHMMYNDQPRNFGNRELK